MGDYFRLSSTIQNIIISKFIFYIFLQFLITSYNLANERKYLKNFEFFETASCDSFFNESSILNRDGIFRRKFVGRHNAACNGSDGSIAYPLDKIFDDYDCFLRPLLLEENERRTER